MKTIKSSHEILTDIDSDRILKKIELAGRTCYKSENKITESTAKIFVKQLIKRGHESVIEHESITVRFICDRGVSHELVRHRLASFSQESTRYVNYANNKELCFIDPNTHIKDSSTMLVWSETMRFCEDSYLSMIEQGVKPEIARSVLPNSIKTEIVVTANLREWRTIFKQRTVPAAHPQMRELMIPLLEELKERLPIIFDDINANK